MVDAWLHVGFFRLDPFHIKWKTYAMNRTKRLIKIIYEEQYDI